MFLLALFGMALAVNQNLNGDYFVSSGARQKVAYNTDYASKGMEYFDVYSKEIATHYGLRTSISWLILRSYIIYVWRVHLRKSLQ